MASQIQVFTQSPYINIEAMEIRNDVQERFSLVLKRLPTPSPATMKTLGCISYILFFAWQVISLVLYSIRAFETSISAKHASFQSTHIKTFRHSEELELIWVISHILNTGLVIMALSKVPSFLGYSAILRRLVCLPSFWSLLSLYGITIVCYFLLIGLTNDSWMETALILAFLIAKGVQAMLIGFLNFTQVNHSRQQSTFKAFVFFKCNIFLLFFTYLLEFVIGSLQFALGVNGINDTSGIPSDFVPVIGIMRRFAVVILSYRIYIFHWEKLFVDNRNLLCNHDYFQNSPKNNNPSTLA